MLKLLLRRSGTKSLKPTVSKPAGAGEIAQGELWLNNNHETPALFARADDDTLIEFKPAAALTDASTTAKGVVQLATSAEAVAGTDTAKAVTPKALHDGYQVKPTVDVVTASKAVAAGTYVVVTTGGLTLALPATPAPGDHLTVVVAGTFVDTKLARNGANIMGLAEDLTLDKPHAAMDLTYVDATNGWRLS
jgi:hypothetical protein